MVKSTEPLVSESSQILTPDLMSKLERMELVSRKIFRGRMKGERRSKRKGQSVEFADFRNYSLGDDLRFIDWNLFARLDRLYLKLFLEEEDLHFFCLDRRFTFHGVWLAEQIVCGEANCSESRLYRALSRRQGFDIQLFNRGSACDFESKSSVHRLVSHVSGISPSAQGASMQEALKRYCTRTRSKGIIVLVTDLMSKEGMKMRFDC